MTEFCILYVTCPNESSAEKISLILLNERLVACSNILPGMKSTYWWQGKIETAQEVVLILKTRKSLFQNCSKIIKDNHPHSTPCILEIPIMEGNPDYLYWLSAETETPR